MTLDLAAAQRRAMDTTRNQQVTEATRIIQEALTSAPRSPPDSSDGQQGSQHASSGHPLTDLRLRPPSTEELGARSDSQANTLGSGSWRRRRPLAQVLEALRQGGLQRPLGSPAEKGRYRPPPPVPEGAQYLARGFRCDAGARDYKLFVAAAVSAGQQPNGLVVMLHGCKQDADDFASGTNMNALAEAHGLVVAYPSQPSAANPSSCWNWFTPAHQHRGTGEPAIIAGITREIASEFGVSTERTFVAGLSAGGAMAVVMGATYPDLYSGVGVHSGLSYKSASDVVSAFAVMRGDQEPERSERPAMMPRTIVFHGTADKTVDRSNADTIVETAGSAVEAGSTRQNFKGIATGRAYTRTSWVGSDGAPMLEYWSIHDGGHAWSGGGPDGSFVDTQGPNASAEMIRFFLAKEM